MEEIYSDIIHMPVPTSSDIAACCVDGIAASPSNGLMLTGSGEDILLPDIDLYLECIDDAQYVIPDTSGPSSHALIGQNIQWKISFPTGQPSKEEETASSLMCPDCGKAFYKEHLFKHHLVSRHSKSVNFNCSDCNFVTKSNRNLQRHKRRVHRKKQWANVFEVDRILQKSPSVNSQEITSKIHPNELNRTVNAPHSQKVSLFEKDCCEARSSDVQPEISINSNLSTLRPVLSSSGSLEREIGDITSDNPSTTLQDLVVLPLTNECSTLNDLYKNSEKIPIEPFVCFKCTTCNFACVGFSKSLKHTHKMMALCSVCSKKFSTVDKLSNHQTLTHPGAVPKQKVCPYFHCQQSFWLKYDLIEHLRNVHRSSLFTCNKQGCQKKFKSAKLLRKHARAHTGLHMCSWEGCGKMFRDKFNLETHISSHAGSKNRQCPHCPYTCVQKASMNWHLKKKHPLFTDDQAMVPNFSGQMINTLHVEIIKT